MATEKTTTPEPLLIFQEEVVYRADPYHQGQRLDTYLSRKMTWRSRNSIQRLIQDGKVFLRRGGERKEIRKPSATVLANDTVHVLLPKPKRDIDFGPEGPPPDPTLETIFEDRWLLALDKPPNVPVHPAGRNLYRTVITALHRRYRRPDDPEHDIVPKLCHRLDLETSGVLLVAKDDLAHRRVQEQIRDRTPQKDYLAIVHGTPEKPSGLIDLPLGPALRKKVYIKRGVRFDRDGQQSRTEYEVVETRGAFSVLKLKLLTGRPHQIRVHCAEIGHPLVGDKIYGESEDLFLKYYDDALEPQDWEKLLLPRQALHAHRLQIQHPMTDEPLDFVAPLPTDLRDFLDRQG